MSAPRMADAQSSLSSFPKIAFTYTEKSPYTFLFTPEQAPQVPFTPYVLVSVRSTDNQVDGYIVTLTFTDKEGVVRTANQTILRTPYWSIALFFTGTATNIVPTARSFKLTDDLITP